MLADRHTHTDRQTDRQTDHDTPLPYRGGVITILTRVCPLEVTATTFSESRTLTYDLTAGEIDLDSVKMNRNTNNNSGQEIAHFGVSDCPDR